MTCSRRLEERYRIQSFLENLCVSLFDEELTKKLKKESLKVRELVKDKVEKASINKSIYYLTKEMEKLEGTEEYEKAFSIFRACSNKRRELWEEVKSYIASGIEPENPIEVYDSFRKEVIDEMETFGLIRREGNRIFFTKKAERIIAKRALKFILERLDKSDGLDEFLSGNSNSLFPERIIEFDEFLHTFDMIDIQESLINEIRVSGKVGLDDNLLAREYEKTGKAVFIILIDTSDSMKGEKLKAAVRAALASKILLEKKNIRNFKIFAFNHSVREMKDGDIVNLRARGRTDISKALMKAVNVAKGMSPKVFLITDGEPTCPNDPVKKAIDAAEMLGKVEGSSLALIMLSKDKKYDEFCERITRKVKNSIFMKLNPEDLSFVLVKTFTQLR